MIEDICFENYILKYVLLVTVFSALVLYCVWLAVRQLLHSLLHITFLSPITSSILCGHPKDLISQVFLNTQIQSVIPSDRAMSN